MERFNTERTAGARDRPSGAEEARKRQDRKAAEQIRKAESAGAHEQSFQAADRAEQFKEKEKINPSTQAEGPTAAHRQQKAFIKKTYARGVREDLDAKNGEAVLPDPEKDTNSRWPGRKKRIMGEAEKQGLRPVRGGYGRGRMTGGAPNSIPRNNRVVTGRGRPGGSLSLSGNSTGSGGRSVRNHFYTDPYLAANGTAVIDVRRSAFYNTEQAMAASAAKKAAARKAFQRRQLRKSYQGATENSIIYIPVISRIRERLHRTNTAAQAGKTVSKKVAEFVEEHPLLIVILLLSGILFFIISTAISGGAMLMAGTTTTATTATTFAAEDEDILGAEQDYRALEQELRNKTADLESEYPGYSEYQLTAAQVGHDPYKLAALLTVLHGAYTRTEVQDTLQEIFEKQYSLTTSSDTTPAERRTVRVGESLGTVVTSGYCNCPICCGQWSGGPTASGVYPVANHTIAVDAHDPIVPMGTKIVMNGVEYTVEDTGNFARYGVAFDVYYDNHQAASNHGHKSWEAYIADDNGTQEVEVLVNGGQSRLNAVLRNKGLDAVADEMLTADQKGWYELLVETKGNKEELFINDIYANPGAGNFDYSVPGEALSDERFARMYSEAKKYLGYPYVWGGSSPDTSFDCSGFVCWVINHSGNGWSVGRTTADGLCNMLPKVRPSEAKPGDIIFFQGTYDTVGASHVGIYLGDNMMIHCGSPIQYADITSSYWQQHFYCFARLPN